MILAGNLMSYRRESKDKFKNAYYLGIFAPNLLLQCNFIML